MGHLRDLPKSKFGVDVDNGFEPDYQPVKGREEIIEALRSAAAKSDKVYLATDPDREGEAIAWHLKELLGLSDERACRVTFNEITKKVVLDGIEHPRAIDTDLVDAQQARRILDRIVGYKLSPLLWKKIRRGLSAGRVQSVVTRIVTDREEEIQAFIPEEYWLLDVDLSLIGKKGRFTAHFYGDEKKKRELTSEDEVNAVTSAIKDAPFVIRGVKRSDKKRSPSPPFITSTLQQEASRKLGMTPRRTMSIAQQLYEGVDIEGEGTIGLITYMRTDSLRLSEDALNDARDFITQRYGADYYPGQPTRYKTKEGAQDAHEAIRPSVVALSPDSIKSSLTSEQYRVYRLIWSRFIASQMAQAIFDSVTVDVVSAGYVFRANHSAMKFAGFMAVYVEGKDDAEEAQESPLPDLSDGDTAKLENIKQEQKFTQPPPRYTEATLIRAMEETGVGRPSTYAATVSTILNREYVVKEGNYLRPTPLGVVVTALMKERFTDIVDVKFTARMEATLDEVEKGASGWQTVLESFYTGFAQSLTDAETALDGERIRVPDEVSEEICDKCGRQLVIKSGRFGRFLACPGYPECDFTKPLVIEMPGRCPKCGGRILKRTSKKGYAYYACENLNRKPITEEPSAADEKVTSCDFMTWDVPVKDNCPECGFTMFKKSGRGSKKPFCTNDTCANFLPEELRTYKKKTPEGDASADGDSPDGAKADDAKSKKKPASKAATKTTKKPAAKSTAKSATKTAAKSATKAPAKTAAKAPNSAPKAPKKAANEEPKS
jgi:DNA topoisomerase-1